MTKLGHGRNHIKRTRKPLHLIVEPEILNFRPDKTPRKVSGEVVVGQTEILQIGKFVKEVRYRTHYVGVAGLKTLQITALSEIVWEDPWRQI